MRVEAFEQAGKAQREALNGLISEAVMRAAEAKSRDRVKRVARILAHAFRSDPTQNYERERELIDVAVQVAESDASILGAMMRHQGEMVKRGAGVADVNETNKTWGRMRKEDSRFTSPRIHVSCTFTGARPHNSNGQEPHGNRRGPDNKHVLLNRVWNPVLRVVPGGGRWIALTAG